MRIASFALATVLASLLLAVPAAAGTGEVTISGKAYEFNHMDTFISGATIRVRELPGVSTTTDANGDYTLRVPDGTTVTPYIEPPEGYNQIDLQTFHTRGADIVNANFQTPADLEYNALRVLLDVPFGPDGRPTECAIVTTASARNVRDVDYQTFWDRTPHGVAGATSIEFPEIPGPTYFNESVIPDPSETHTSEDGGIIWTEVPTGAYRIGTISPTTRFAGFLANCAPGRIINANPPWGAYELAPGEKQLPSSSAIAGIRGASMLVGGSQAGAIKVSLEADESVGAKLVAFDADGRPLDRRRVEVEPGRASVKLVPTRKPSSSKVTVRVKFTDQAGGRGVDEQTFRIPRG
jgi:hypothetical protein